MQAAVVDDYPDLLLVTVISLTLSREQRLPSLIQDWLTGHADMDDVFRKEFLSGVVFCLESEDAIPASGELEEAD